MSDTCIQWKRFSLFYLLWSFRFLSEKEKPLHIKHVCLIDLSSGTILTENQNAHIRTQVSYLVAGFILDKEDRSITRSDPYYKDLFNQCGLYPFKSRVKWLCIWFSLIHAIFIYFRLFNHQTRLQNDFLGCYFILSHYLLLKFISRTHFK